MSIHDEVLDRIARGMIFPVLPRAKGAVIRRAMFVSQSLHTVLTSPEGDQEWERRVAELQADLEVFVEARTIDPKYLFLLYPARDAVWEIRSTRNSPSIRVLGVFADKDVFVATHHTLREQLGGWESREWKIEKRRSGAEWRRLFNPYSPRSEIDAKNLVTGALDGKYFKTSRR